MAPDRPLGKEVRDQLSGGGGTFAPFFRASDRPIAIACFRLVTFPPRPPLPLRNVPAFSRRMALSTLLLAASLYRLVPECLGECFGMVHLCWGIAVFEETPLRHPVAHAGGSLPPAFPGYRLAI